MRLLALGLVVALPSLGHAGPITAGVGLGIIQSQVDSAADPNHTIAIFGRLAFTPRLAGQLELQRIQTDNQNVDLRTASALLVVDLGSRGRLVPVMLAGLGFDTASTTYGGDSSGHHIEGGFGLEYRADGGFSIGADVRMGGRTIDSQPVVFAPVGCSSCLASQPSTLHDGEYRSARLTVGVRF